MPDIHIDSTVNACVSLRDGLPYIACSGANYSALCPNRKVPDNVSSSHVCIPMITGGEVNGVLSVSFQPERVLIHDEMNVLLSIANQASMTIQRYNLFETLKKERLEIEKAYTEISILNERLKEKIEELKEARYRLLQSEKLVAIGELVAGLCHEINNPLSVILNRIECLRMESKEIFLPEGVLKDLDVIFLFATRVSSMVQDLLIFSRPHSVEFKPVNIIDILEVVIKMLDGDINTFLYA